MRLGPIELTTSPLVSGPWVVFKIFGLPVSITVVTTWFIILLFFIIFKLGTKNLKLKPGKLQLILEVIYEGLDGAIGQILGDWKKKYFTFFATLFLFIFPSNIISFFPIPWGKMIDKVFVISPAFRSPTSDLNTTVSLALIVATLFTATNLKYNGLGGYLKGFISPTPVILPLNIVGELAKPLNMSMRLFGNMFAGSVILGLLYMAVPWGIPAPLHLYFDLFSGMVQTFVFATLAMVYTQGAIGDVEYKD